MGDITAQEAPAGTALDRPPRRWRRLLGAWRRWSLWALLLALVASMLVTLVWLAGRYEAGEVQSRLERDSAEQVAYIDELISRRWNLSQINEAYAALKAGEVNRSVIVFD